MPKWKMKRKRDFNAPPLPPEVLAEKRDTILENDPTHIENLRALNRRVASGKVPTWQCENIRQALAMHALRRAGVSLRESMHLIAL